MLGATLAFAMARIRLARGASRDESTIPPGATVETGAISAEEYGGKGKEIILIPGLGGGAGVGPICSAAFRPTIGFTR